MANDAQEAVAAASPLNLFPKRKSKLTLRDALQFIRLVASYSPLPRFEQTRQRCKLGFASLERGKYHTVATTTTTDVTAVVPAVDRR